MCGRRWAEGTRGLDWGLGQWGRRLGGTRDLVTAFALLCALPGALVPTPELSSEVTCPGKASLTPPPPPSGQEPPCPSSHGLLGFSTSWRSCH